MGFVFSFLTSLRALVHRQDPIPITTASERAAFMSKSVKDVCSKVMKLQLHTQPKSLGTSDQSACVTHQCTSRL
jgi:hypothetical protein